MPQQPNSNKMEDYLDNYPASVLSAIRRKQRDMQDCATYERYDKDCCGCPKSLHGT